MEEKMNNEENSLPPGMAELEREIDDDNDYDVNSLDIQSRSDGSIALALAFTPGFNVSQRTSHGVKSFNTRKSSTKPKRATTAVKSRAPPKKSYEPAPFLIIDNLPDSKSEKVTESCKKETAKNRATSYSHSLTVPRNTPTPTTAGRSTVGFQRIGSGQALSCSSSEWNKLVPRRSRALYKQMMQNEPNRHTQTPFKHNQASYRMEKAVVMPDQKLKELTVLATYEVAKAIAKQQPETERKIQGRLLKARLKPLNTVNVSGPTINQCRGIVAGTHSYKPSPNRTLQRRRQLLQNLNKDYMRDRPQTAESIHHTSVASDNTDVRDQDELDYLLLATVGADDEETQVFGIPPNSLASFNEMMNHQAINAMGQDIPEFPDDEQLSVRSPKSDKAEEVASEEDPDIQVVAEAEKYFLESDDEIRKSLENNVVTSINTSSLHRPMSMHDTGLRKSVRFADAAGSGAAVSRGRSRSAMPCFRQDRIPNPRHEEVSRSTKQKSRSSCRPESTEVKSSWRDDTDHDPNGSSSNSQRGAWSVNSATANHSSSASQAGTPRKSATGGNTEKTEVLRTSVGEVKFDCDDNYRASQRPQSQTGVRLRARLGEWEDLIKPEDCGDLVISGKGKGLNERETEMKGILQKRTGGYSQKGKRPLSAKGPYEYIMEEKRQVMWRSRPASAAVDGLNNSVSAMTAILNVRPQSARKPAQNSTRPCSGTKQLKKTTVIASKRPRPSSGKLRRPTSAKLLKTKNNTRQVSAKGSQRKACSYCGKATDKNINYEDGSYFIVCNNCNKQSYNADTDATMEDALPSDEDISWDINANAVAKCLANEMIQRQAQQLERDTDNDVAVDSSSYQGMQYGRCGSHGRKNVSELIDAALPSDNEITFQSKEEPNSEAVMSYEDSSQSGVVPCSERSEPSEEGQILTNLNELEKSLTDVQMEIKDCLKQTRFQNDDASNDYHGNNVKLPSDVQTRESEVSGSNKVCQFTGEGAFSTQLVGDTDHWKAVENNVKIYQFVEKDRGSEKHKDRSINNTCHEISSYEATMMSPPKTASGTHSADQMSSKQLREAGPKEYKERNATDSSLSRSDEESLEVKATAKTILKQMCEAGSHPICPHPVLSFTINARPPSGYMYYFAYGMDMNPDRLSTYIRREVTERFWGLLFGFKLIFNKKGVDEEAGGFPNIELCDHCSVEGSLQLITPSELSLLDKWAGYPEHYAHVVLPVWQLNCLEADELGVAQYCVPAVMYVAKDRWTHRGDTPLDSSYAADQCLKNNTLLSPEYTKRLHQYRNHWD